MVEIERISSFVALGDSFTEGLHDELDGVGRHRGWADRVAAGLAVRNPGLRYANLAVRGRLLDEVVAEQIPAALECGAELVSFHAGPNDVLRPGADLPALAHRYDRAVATLRAAGREVLLFTVLERAGGKGRLADLLASRFAAFNAAVRATAERHGAVLVDVGDVTALHDPRMWHADRLHLAPAGHVRITAAVLEALGVDDPGLLGGPAGWWREPLPEAELRRIDAVGADVQWAARYLAPWIVRRVRGVSSGDGVACKQPALIEVPIVGRAPTASEVVPARRRSRRELDRFDGLIAAGAFTSGEQVVIGLWRRSPLGRFIDVMWIRADGERVLLAPNRSVRDYVAALYGFDRTEVVPIRGGWDGRRVEVSAGPLVARLEVAARDWRSWVFAARPKALRRAPWWLAIEDRLVEPLGGALLGGADGVRVTGTTPSGRREWYSVDDYRAVGAGSLTVDGRDAGRLTQLRGDLGVGVSAFPTRPALVNVVTLIEPSRVPQRTPA
jgi:lysophospholipase L1-like esterase